MDSLKTKTPLRRGVLAAMATLTSVALILASPLSASPAQAAPGEGDVTLSVVDPTGAQLGGMFYLVPEGSTNLFSGINAAGITPTETVPAGRYGVVVMSPWGGYMCAGVTPCTSATITGGGSSTVTVTPVIDVPDAGTTNYEFKAAVPATISGKKLPGGQQNVMLSPAVQELVSIYGGAYGGVATQWTRNGTNILNATTPSYTVALADVGSTLAARLSWTGILAAEFAEAGLPAAPRTVSLGGRVSKLSTVTRVQVFRSKIIAGKSTGLRADVTSTSQPATGKVKITIGKWKATRTLRNGSLRLQLPKNLKPGKYKIIATYLGSTTHSESKDTDELSVQAKPKKK